MNKLFKLLLRKDIRLSSVEQHWCQLIWHFNSKDFLVHLTDQGYLSLTLVNQFSKSISEAEINQFISIFFNHHATYKIEKRFNSIYFVFKSNQALMNDLFIIVNSSFKGHKDQSNILKM